MGYCNEILDEEANLNRIHPEDIQLKSLDGCYMWVIAHMCPFGHKEPIIILLVAFS